MERKKGSGRPRSARTTENESFVEEMICSQEDEPGTHASPREITRELVSLITLYGESLKIKVLQPIQTCKNTTDERCTHANVAVDRAVVFMRSFEITQG